MLTESVVDELCEDGIKPDDIGEMTFISKIWLLYKNDDEVIGTISILRRNCSTIEIHPYLITDYREQGIGNAMMREFYDYYINHIDKKVIKINCCIPFCARPTYKFAKKLGFKDEGINKDSFVKYGNVWDQWYLGITKGQVKEFLCQE